MAPSPLLASARVAGQSLLRLQSDERLTELARAGNEPAFEAIVARYRGPLLGYCTKLLSEGRGEDAVQQTFVKAYTSIAGGEEVRKLRPWLYRIAHNTALNLLRDRGLNHSQLDEQLDGVERPDQAAERRQELEHVVAAVQALPDRQRDAIVLRELEGRSYDEIAGRLGVTGGAVRQLLNRARTSVRAGLTAVTPVGLLLRIPMPVADAPVTARVAELVGTGGGAAVAAKLCATAAVGGTLACGVTALPVERPEPAKRTRAESTPAAKAAARGATTLTAAVVQPRALSATPRTRRTQSTTTSTATRRRAGSGGGSSEARERRHEPSANGDGDPGGAGGEYHAHARSGRGSHEGGDPSRTGRHHGGQESWAESPSGQQAPQQTAYAPSGGPGPGGADGGQLQSGGGPPLGIRRD